MASPPTGTLFPGGIDTGTPLNIAVLAGGIVYAPYTNIIASAVLAIEGSLGVNPAGPDLTVGLALALRARITDVQYQTFTYADDTGVANAYVVSIAPAPVSYVEGQQIVFKALSANTGPSTINVDGLGSVSIVKDGSVALSGGEIAAGQIISIVYDGTNFQIVGSSGGGGTITLTGDVTGSGTSSIATTIAATGVTSGTYPKVTVNAKGQVTAGTTLSPSDIPSGYTGGTSIDTLGTVTTGTWEGTDVAVAYGGTGASTASGARSNLGAAASGANSDLTSLSGLTTPLSVGQGGTGLSGPLHVGDLLVGTGSTTVTNLGVGTNNQLVVADSTQTAGMRWANTMFGINGNVFLPNAKYVQKQVLNAASGANDIGTPASGKRWMVYSCLASNPTAGSITAYLTFKNGGNYYQWSTSETVNTGVYASSIAIVDILILESTDTLSVHCSAAGLSLFLNILEFDTTSNLKSVKVLSLSTGNNTIYAAPSGMTSHSPNLTGNPSGDPGLTYCNFSGATRTMYHNLVLSGGSPVAPGTSGTNALQASQSFSNGTVNMVANNLYVTLNTGDFINLHVDAATATQYAWVTVVEWTT